MKHIISIALLLLAHGCATFSSTAQTIQPSELRELARRSMMPVVYKVPGQDRVQVVQNIKYTPATDPNIAMDIYSPPERAKSEKLPAVIFIHGGARAE